MRKSRYTEEQIIGFIKQAESGLPIKDLCRKRGYGAPSTVAWTCPKHGGCVNWRPKKVYRLYSAANLAVRKRKKVKRPANERVPLQLARSVNEVWSMDFVSDSLSTGRRIRCLTVADDFSHKCVSISVDWGISVQ